MSSVPTSVPTPASNVSNPPPAQAPAPAPAPAPPPSAATPVAPAPSASQLAPASAPPKPPAMAPKPPVPPRKPPLAQRPAMKAPAKASFPRPRPFAASSPPPQQATSASGQAAGMPTGELPKESSTSAQEKENSERSGVAKKPVADARAALKQQQAAVRAAEASALAADKTVFDKLLEKTAAGLTKKIQAIEEDVEKMEEDYITSTWSHGNVLRGWDGFVRRVDRTNKGATGTGSGTATGAPKYRKTRPSDRIFSLSSSTSNFRRANPDVQIQKRPPDKKKKKKR